MYIYIRDGVKYIFQIEMQIKILFHENQIHIQNTNKDIVMIG